MLDTPGPSFARRDETCWLAPAPAPKAAVAGFVAATRHDQSAQDAKSAQDASGATRTECVLTVCAGACADAIGAAIPIETTNRPASNSLKRIIRLSPSRRGAAAIEKAATTWVSQTT